MRFKKLGRAQRVVVVVALGVAFLAVGSFILSLGQSGLQPTAVFEYAAPITARWHSWVPLIVWLIQTCLWAAASIRLLRPSVHDEAD